MSQLQALGALHLAPSRTYLHKSFTYPSDLQAASTCNHLHSALEFHSEPTPLSMDLSCLFQACFSIANHQCHSRLYNFSQAAFIAQIGCLMLIAASMSDVNMLIIALAPGCSGSISARSPSQTLKANSQLTQSPSRYHLGPHTNTCHICLSLHPSIYPLSLAIQQSAVQTKPSG